ncbi:MAG TPA: SgcJ/EcaC family oxidoreductase [Blastocatellia bacterium]|nr:SgcJ/EcaC family oxidoreductase [Blastocatellia bacterium]
MHSLEETVEEIDEAFNRGDVEAVLDFYEDGAVMVLEPGRLARGKDEMRRAFEAILGLEGIAKQIKTSVIEADDIALFTSKWSFSGKAPDGTSFSRDSFATTVFRKQTDGKWRCVIDNSYGPAILD